MSLGVSGMCSRPNGRRRVVPGGRSSRGWAWLFDRGDRPDGPLSRGAGAIGRHQFLGAFPVSPVPLHGDRANQNITHNIAATAVHSASRSASFRVRLVSGRGEPILARSSIGGSSTVDGRADRGRARTTNIRISSDNDGAVTSGPASARQSDAGGRHGLSRAYAFARLNSRDSTLNLDGEPSHPQPAAVSTSTSFDVAFRRRYPTTSSSSRPSSAIAAGVPPNDESAGTATFDRLAAVHYRVSDGRDSCRPGVAHGPGPVRTGLHQRKAETPLVHRGRPGVRGSASRHPLGRRWAVQFPRLLTSPATIPFPFRTIPSGWPVVTDGEGRSR